MHMHWPVKGLGSRARGTHQVCGSAQADAVLVNLWPKTTLSLAPSFFEDLPGSFSALCELIKAHHLEHSAPAKSTMQPVFLVPAPFAAFRAALRPSPRPQSHSQPARQPSIQPNSQLSSKSTQPRHQLCSQSRQPSSPVRPGASPTRAASKESTPQRKPGKWEWHF